MTAIYSACVASYTAERVWGIEPLDRTLVHADAGSPHCQIIRGYEESRSPPSGDFQPTVNRVKFRNGLFAFETARHLTPVYGGACETGQSLRKTISGSKTSSMCNINSLV